MITGFSSAVFAHEKLFLSIKITHLKEVYLVKSLCWLGPNRFRIPELCIDWHLFYGLDKFF